MNEIKCETVMLSAMAEFDGEAASLLSSEQSKAHLAVCENCRREIEQMQTAIGLLHMQTRRAQTADLWHLIEKRIEPRQENATQLGWKMFALLAAFLVAFKLLEMLPAEEFGFWFKFVPLVSVVALFGFLKENPFKINTQLTLENDYE